MVGGKIIDPVCDMIVTIDEARDIGLAQRKDEGNSSVGGHAHEVSDVLPEIDAGMRAWYESCRCCLSDAHPRVVEVLDAERASAKAPPADAGICETAESG